MDTLGAGVVMADPKHVEILRQGAKVWNAWREDNAKVRPILSGADLDGIDINGANLDIADLDHAKIRGATAKSATFNETNLYKADLSRTLLAYANLLRADLGGTKLIGTNLSEAFLGGVNFEGADLTTADLSSADLRGANFFRANLTGAKLNRANLSGAQMVESNLEGATLSESRIYGLSAWKVKVDLKTEQRDLVITDDHEAKITVDNIEVAQFVYLLLHNEKIRDVIDTVGKKGVLLLGRFTAGRIEVLERLRDELRKRGYLPIVFNFDKPETKDFTETVRLLAGLSKFVIADITNPKSAPLELQATVPEIMVPFRPIIEKGEKPFAMLQDLWIKHREWVFEPIYYSSVDALIASLNEKIIQPAEARFVELVRRKAETMGGEDV
jgi:hypothetical protein